MSISYEWLNWEMINYCVPFLGLLLCATMLFNKHYCTKRKSISTLVVFFALMWLNLTWADFGSDTFTPSRQSMTARILLVLIMVLILVYVRSVTSEVRHLVTTIHKLKADKAALIEQLQTKGG